MESSKDTALGLLALLQDLDRVQREKKEMLRSLEVDLERMKGELTQQRAQTAAKQAEREALDARQRELEAQLEDEETKLKDRRMRLNRVRNEKELQALRREIEVGKETNQRNEEELMRVLEGLEVAVAVAAESEQALATLEATAADQVTSHNSQIAAIIEGADRESNERTRIATSLDKSLLRKYEQIFDRRGGTAVVEVRSGICQGCHMNLPPQLANELQRSADIRLCPNCHRILFSKSDRSELPQAG